MAVPHTEVTLKSFDVRYSILRDNEKEEIFTEINVKPDRLRLLVDADGNIMKADTSIAIDDVPASPTVASVIKAPPIIESTG